MRPDPRGRALMPPLANPWRFENTLRFDSLDLDLDLDEWPIVRDYSDIRVCRSQTLRCTGGPGEVSGAPIARPGTRYPLPVGRTGTADKT